MKIYDKIEEILPLDLRERQQLINNRNALKYINIPEVKQEIKLAIRRIKFEELFSIS